MKIKKFDEFKINESSEEPVKVANGTTSNGDVITIYLYKTSTFDNYYYAVDENGEDWSDISTKLPGNELLDSIWVKDGGYEEEGAKILTSNNILNRTEVTTTSGNGMNTYRKYDII